MTAHPNSEITSPDMQISGPVTAELNYIKPDATIRPEVVYSGGEAPQKYNDAYAFMPAKIEDGRKFTDQFEIHKQGFQLVNAPTCLLYTSPSPRDQRGSRMPSSA